jgi:hypothetical protein
MEALEISHLQPTGCTFPIYCSESASCDDCTELKIVDMKLSRLDQHRWKAVLSKRRYLRLHERRSLILSRINARRDPVSVKLPPEVVCQIFHVYIGLHPAKEINLWPFSNARHRDKPIFFETFQPSANLRLGAVCRQWRSIAWEYSPLWNSLHVNITQKHCDHGPQIILEWLERSKNLPLDIRVVPSDSVRGPGVSLDVDVAIMKAIRACVSRWRSVDLRIYEDSTAMDLADIQFLSREHPSYLRHLSLYGQYYGDGLSDCPPINFLSYARRELCKLQILLALTDFRYLVVRLDKSDASTRLGHEHGLGVGADSISGRHSGASHSSQFGLYPSGLDLTSSNTPSNALIIITPGECEPNIRGPAVQ